MSAPPSPQASKSGVRTFAVIGALSGLIWGSMSFDPMRMLLTSAIGGLIGAQIATHRRMAALEQALVDMAALRAQPVVAEPALPESSPADSRAESPAEEAPTPSETPESSESVSDIPVDPPRTEAVQPAAANEVASGVDAWLAAAGIHMRGFFLGGNTVVRVGILVLLVGVGLLVKYAADNDLVAIEYRMIGAALLGLALTGFGFRQRVQRPGFGRTLQGGGIAALYLVVFFSYRSYELLPPAFAFALLVAIAVLGGLLAVVQNAMALVVIAQLGGFLAPVLASSGQGSHVALFSYYAVLNLAVFVVAWFRQWRPLNLVGFVCTFGIATTWGVLRYEPGQLMTTEPFLVGFFLLYVAIPVIFALRSPGKRRGWVDGSLVFGTPLTCLLLQAALVHDIAFAMAFSCLAMAGLYLGLAFWLRRRYGPQLSAMVESFLALGIGFATLAIPYGLGDHHLTGATWAVEGAGIYWLGVRQQRWFSRLSGVVLQLLAGIAVLAGLDGFDPDQDILVLNSRFFAAVLVCFGALTVARTAYAGRAQLRRFEVRSLQGLIAWGLAFWLGIAIDELDYAFSSDTFAAALVGLLGVTAITLELLGRRLDWLPGRWPAAMCIPLGFLLLMIWEWGMEEHLLGHGAWLTWPVYMLAVFLVVVRFVRDGPGWARHLAALSLWWLMAFCGLELRRLAVDVLQLPAAWGLAGVGLAVAMAIAGACVWAAKADRQTSAVVPSAYLLEVSALGAAAAGLLWLCVTTAFAPGTVAPLPYVPLLNPVDLSLLGLLFAAALWQWMLNEPRQTLRTLWLLSCFIWLNGALARAVFHMTEMPDFDWDELWDSWALQLAFSIVWTLVGLSATVWASRNRGRWAWFAGAGLLGLTVIKLFIIDLAQLGGVAKIASFIVVGLLLLVVGYFAPVPPAKAELPGEA